MKKRVIFFSFVMVLFLTSCYSTKNFNNFYDRYEFSENSTSMTAPIELAKILVPRDSEMRGILNKLKSVKLLTLSEMDDDQKTIVKNELNAALQADGFSNWFSSNKENSTITVRSKNRGNTMKNLVFAIQGDDDLMIVSAKTRLSQSDVKKLADFLWENKK